MKLRKEKKPLNKRLLSFATLQITISQFQSTPPGGGDSDELIVNHNISIQRVSAITGGHSDDSILSF